MIVIKIKIDQLSNGDMSIRDISEPSQIATPREAGYADAISAAWKEAVKAHAAKIDPDSEVEHRRDRGGQ